ncbi:hypothetical protein NDU88_004937 [Pleurodeles waltl]|uniref:Uncharacterized protein n=1 Tax=Pleurodeles waltl TaxID=8319 RepID=A0AAV7MVA8_PLEWA|nr:hypothetical protein NDU88_004937 [Pleurodeles waltl]
MPKSHTCKQKPAPRGTSGRQAVGIIDKKIKLAERRLSVASQLSPPLRALRDLPPSLDVAVPVFQSNGASGLPSVDVDLPGAYGGAYGGTLLSSQAPSKAPVPWEPELIIVDPNPRTGDDLPGRKRKQQEPIRTSKRQRVSTTQSARQKAASRGMS